MSLSSVPVDSGQHRLVLRLGGLGALCAVVVFVLGMGWGVLSPDESTAELFILTTPIFTPLLLIPTVGALYTIYRPTAPRLSRVMLGLAGVGLTGMILLPILELLDIPTNPMRGHHLLVGCLALLLANGLWPILAGGLELTDPMPTFTGMGIGAILAGGLLTLFILCIMNASRQFLGGNLLGLVLPVLIIMQCVWLSRMSYRFLIDP